MTENPVGAFSDGDYDENRGSGVLESPFAATSPPVSPGGTRAQATVRVVPSSGDLGERAAGEPSEKPHRRGAREEQLIGALKDLMRNDGDMEAAALVSMDGFMMASALPAGMQADRVAAMSAAILGLGERVAAELGRGGLSELLVEGEEGYVLVMAAGTHAVLTGLAGKTAKLGLVLYNMRDTAATVARVLG